MKQKQKAHNLHYIESEEGLLFLFAQALIQQGADVNARNSFNNTALTLAAYHGHAAVVQALISSGAHTPPQITDSLSLI